MSVVPKILIVDDSKVVRSAVRYELGASYDYREAADGREALQIIKSGFLPDLITLDIEMPVLGGFETCERLYSSEFTRIFAGVRDGRVPVVFLTASDTLTERRRGFELGAIDFVAKNFVSGSLAALVKQILSPADRLRDVQVLLVDDSRVVRQIVAAALREVGVKILEAADGLEAYQILCNRLSSIDLVITDIDMPQMSGIELCRRVRREIGLADLPVVFFTGADPKFRVEAFQAGATDCLVKPFLKEEMIARIGAHIEKALLNGRLRRALAEQRANLQGQRDMLATLSHDMRAPLSGIMGYADLLSTGMDRTPAEQENISQIKLSGQMLLSLVGDILSLSKQQSGRAELELQPLELGPLLARSAAMFQGVALRKRQKIEVENAAGGFTVAGHGESLTRVFNNLISNALKFTPEDGLIRVVLEPASPGEVAAVVSDTGIGIPPDKIARIFDRYSDCSRKGTAGEASTGLGMSIVREFVEAHRGRINVTSTPGQGTQFRLTFPLVEAAAHPAAAKPNEGESRHGQLSRLVQGRRVLLADDNPINQMVARAILAKAGCVVTAVTNGREALDLVLASPAGFDVVFMDMQMPVMNGLVATRAIREAGITALAVIALTGNVDEADRQNCIAAGMTDFLSKPFTPRVMLEKIVQHCGPAAGATASCFELKCA